MEMSRVPEAGERAVSGPEAPAGAHVEMTIPADTRSLSQVRDAVRKLTGHGLFSPVKANMIALAVDEAVANIIEHAYGADPGSAHHGIRIVMNADAKRFEVSIRDRGTAFDPRGAPDVDVKQHVEAGRKGGLGIFLMRRIMDEISYSFKQGVHNELRMIKYVDEHSAENKSKLGAGHKSKGQKTG